MPVYLGALRVARFQELIPKLVCIADGQLTTQKHVLVSTIRNQKAGTRPIDLKSLSEPEKQIHGPMRKILLLTLLPVVMVVLYIGCSSLNMYQAPPREKSEPTTEDYAFYSSLYRASKWLQADEVIAISERIISAARSSDRACFKARNMEERALETLALQLDGKDAAWKNRFDFGRPYKILAENDAIRAENCIVSNGMPTNESCKPFRGIRYVRYLSLPAFSREHTRALGLAPIVGTKS